MRLFFEPIGTRAIGWLGYSFVGGKTDPRSIDGDVDEWS